jgi:hypothetical protein
LQQRDAYGDEHDDGATRRENVVDSDGDDLRRHSGEFHAPLNSQTGALHQPKSASKVKEQLFAT